MTRPFAEGERTFSLAVACPPSASLSGEAGGSPGQGNNILLCDLCVSVVQLFPSVVAKGLGAHS
jgi:hypothetical protein